MRDAGHFIRIGTKHGDHKFYEYDGIEVCEGIDTLLINKMLAEERFDYIFTQWDIWLLYEKRQYPKSKWIAYIPIDTERIADALAEVAANVGTAIAMSKHGKRELDGLGLADVRYAPHGFDDKVFRILPEGRSAFRSGLGLTDENFVIGSVGLNYGDDRKGFIPLMLAFKEFHERHPEARLYLHTNANDRMTIEGGINYHKIVRHLGIQHWTYWPDQAALYFNRIDPPFLAEIYNGMDVFCLPTKGEGFGIPIIEAQACGVPVATTATTSGPELTRTGWLIEVDGDCREWMATGTWRLAPRPSKILAALEAAHEAWCEGRMDREATRAAIIDYSWDAVWETHWLPFWRDMEAKLG